MIPALRGPVHDVSELVLPRTGTARADGGDATTWRDVPRGRTGLRDLVDARGEAVAQCVHPRHVPALLAAAAEHAALRARVAELEARLAARDARQLELPGGGR